MYNSRINSVYTLLSLVENIDNAIGDNSEAYSGQKIESVGERRHLIYPVDYPRASLDLLNRFAQESGRRFYASHNDLCSTTIRLIILANALIQNHPAYCQEVGISLQVEKNVPLYWAPNSAATVKKMSHADLVITKRGLGRRDSGIAVVSSLPAVFVVRTERPDIILNATDPIYRIDTLLGADLMLADKPGNYLPTWGTNPGPVKELTRSLFDDVTLDLPFLLEILASHGFPYKSDQLPFTTYTNRLETIRDSLKGS